MDSLYGLKVVVRQDHITPVVRYRFPKTKVRTKSIRKAYQRLRRRTPVLIEYVRSGPEGAFQIGDTLSVDQKTWEEIRKHTAEAAEKKLFENPAPAGYTNCGTTADVTVDSLLRVMDEFRVKFPESPFRKPEAFEDYTFKSVGLYNFPANVFLDPTVGAA